MNKRILIVGAGGFGQSVAEAILLADEYELAGFVDDANSSDSLVCGLPVLGRIDHLRNLTACATFAVVALGNNRLRNKIAIDLVSANFLLATVIHPRAFVSPSAKIGLGSTIMAGAVIGTEAKLGDCVIVNSGAVVDHHCQLGDFAHLGVNVAMAGGSSLGRLAWMQAGSVLGCGVNIAPERVLQPGEFVA